MATATCATCGALKPGVKINGQQLCDDCMNSPARTRPWLHGRTETLGAALVEVSQHALPGSGPAPVFNRVEIRDDDEDGPLVLPPKDGDLHPVAESEIEKARVEQASDARKYEPSNEKTRLRIGAEMMGEHGTSQEAKPAVEAGRAKATTAVVKGAGRAAGGAKRAASRKSVARR